jgi:predicted dehydrogenase
MHRRKFLGSLAAASLSPTLARGTPARRFEGLRVGVIGCGWYGKNDMARLLQIAPVDVRALCDPDSNMLAEAAALAEKRQVSRKRPAIFSDYREMLAAEKCDLVIIGTPDHWHALPAIAAMEAGAHLYLQKPVAVDVAEGFAILDTARRLDRVVQIGTQRRSTPHIIEAREKIIASGKLGTVGHVEMFSYYHMRRRGAPPHREPPPELDWEMWTGPAPLRPYHDGIHPGGWRSFREYGNGIVGDMCVHMLDTARWLLDVGWPKRITSTGGVFIDPESHSNVPDTQTAVFQYENLTMTWQHRTWGHPADPADPWGLVLYGSKGVLKVNVRRCEFIPIEKNAQGWRSDFLDESAQFPEEREEPRAEAHASPATRRHLANLLDSIENKTRPVANIEEGNISSSCCVLANLALETGRALAFDPANRTIPNDPEATALLRRQYRAPWKHPAGA